MIQSIAKLPRISLGNYPTPLMEARRLSAALGGPRIIIKRDDMSGLALGGNKCRKLEFVMADAKKKGVDTVITTGGSQSNFALQLATAASLLDMKAYSVLVKSAHSEVQGNLLLHNILDSNVIQIDPSEISDYAGDAIMTKMNALADDLRKQGRRPLVIPVGAHTPLGTTGWVNAVEEIWQQLQAQNIDAQYIVVAHGSSGTHAGLELGVNLLGLPIKVIGFSINRPKATALSRLITIANETADMLNLDITLAPEQITVNDDYIGEGYGIITDGCARAIKLVAQTEGIFLDPVYTAKAMAGLIDFIHKGHFTAKDTVVFIHSGGLPALFAYNRELS